MKMRINQVSSLERKLDHRYGCRYKLDGHIFTSLRTVHGPPVEGDAAGRRESGWSWASVTAVNVGSYSISFYTCWRATGAAASFTSTVNRLGSDVECSQARRLGFRPEFGTQLEADVRVAWKAERHLQRRTIKRNRQVRMWITVFFLVFSQHATSDKTRNFRLRCRR